MHAQVHEILHLSSTRAGQTFGLLGEERAHAHDGCSLARRKTEKFGTRRRGTKFWEKSPIKCCSVCVTIECRSALKCAEQKHYRHCHVFHHETMHTEHSELGCRGEACARENYLSTNTFCILSFYISTKLRSTESSSNNCEQCSPHFTRKAEKNKMTNPKSLQEY